MKIFYNNGIIAYATEYGAIYRGAHINIVVPAVGGMACQTVITINITIYSSGYVNAIITIKFCETCIIFMGYVSGLITSYGTICKFAYGYFIMPKASVYTAISISIGYFNSVIIQTTKHNTLFKRSYGYAIITFFAIYAII